MIIYSFDTQCYHCKKNIKVHTYICYKSFYGDVIFPYENWMMNEIYTHINNGKYFDKQCDSLNYPIETIGFNEEYDKIILDSHKVPNLSIFKSKEVSHPYVANRCIHCNYRQGRSPLLGHVTDKYLKPNIELTIECEI